MTGLATLAGLCILFAATAALLLASLLAGSPALFGVAAIMVALSLLAGSRGNLS